MFAHDVSHILSVFFFVESGVEVERGIVWLLKCSL